jgi:hypothetical protein
MNIPTLNGHQMNKSTSKDGAQMSNYENTKYPDQWSKGFRAGRFDASQGDHPISIYSLPYDKLTPEDQAFSDGWDSGQRSYLGNIDKSHVVALTVPIVEASQILINILPERNELRYLLEDFIEMIKNEIVEIVEEK